MKKSEAVNVMSEGLVMDLNPLVTPNNVVTNALNATLITMNGNENALQNDMGNGRVETAYLPEGYVPIGTAELGGIIYIVSYNPLTDKCQIGSFPSPERNITTDELGETEKILKTLDFYNGNDLIITPSKKLILTDKELHPGDKFQIYCTQLKDVEYISAREPNNNNADLYPRYLKFNVVAIQDNGKITNLNDTLVWQDNNYYILDNKITYENGKLSLDEYRNLIQSNYNVFNSKVDGRLAILAELECISQFDVSWDAIKIGNKWNIYLFLNWGYDNEQARDKINLYSVRITTNSGISKDIVIDNYPKSNTESSTNDIMENEATTFYTPYYVDSIEELPDYHTNGGIITPRYNNGSDNQFLLTTPIELDEGSPKTVNFTIYPGMPFGFLDYLKQTFTIDTSKLGTGSIDLIEYRYFWNTDSVTLNWGLEAYPERNKSIKYVQFKFYEFNQDIYNWINNNSTNIDNNRIINNTWENSTGTALSASYDKVYTIDNQSSYSGNFSDNITILDNNKLYLVEIEINYNNEQNIKYYRFLYTSSIFNDYYFTVEDYKNISLEEAIINRNLITTEVTNLNINNIQTNQELKNGQSIQETIPSYLKQDTTETINYTITNTYSSDIEFNLSPITDNDTFDITINNVNISTPEVNSTYSTDMETVNNAGNSTTGTSIDPISINNTLTDSVFNNDTYSGKISQIIIAPFRVEYLTHATIPIQYELKPLDVAHRWLLFYGTDRRQSCYFYLTTEYGLDYSISSEFGDDSNICQRFSYYQALYNEVKQLLTTYDVVALKFRLYDQSDPGGSDKGSWTMTGRGAWHGSDHEYKFAESRFYAADGRATTGGTRYGAVIPIYAMLNQQGDIKLFMFAHFDDESHRNPGGYIQNWYHMSFSGQSATTYVNDESMTYVHSNPFGVEQRTVTDENLEAPFKKYHKLIQSSNSLDIVNWTRISYYKPYTVQTNIAFNGTYNYNLAINDVIITQNQNFPKNLYYSGTLKFNSVVTIPNQIDYSTYLDYVLYGNSNDTLILLPDGSVITKEVNNTLLYDELCNEIRYLKQDNGINLQALLDMNNTTHEIRMYNNRLQVKVGSINTYQNLLVQARQEEQSVCVSDLIQINS